jgi:hypothetical protein
VTSDYSSCSNGLPEAYSHKMRAKDQCSVLWCAGGVQRKWSTGETHAEEAEWDVCLPHFLRMRGGEDWATHTDLPRSNEQWIVMGTDLAVRTSETLQGWRLSVEFGADGRNIRLALSSNKDEIGVLLDDYHANELSQALSQLCRSEAERPRDWSY